MGRDATGVAIRLSIGFRRVRSPYVPLPAQTQRNARSGARADLRSHGSEAFMAKRLVEAQETVVRVHPDPLRIYGEASRLATASGLNPDEPAGLGGSTPSLS